MDEFTTSIIFIHCHFINYRSNKLANFHPKGSSQNSETLTAGETARDVRRRFDFREKGSGLAIVALTSVRDKFSEDSPRVATIKRLMSS